MNLPELETKDQYADYLVAITKVSKFGDFTNRVRRQVSDGQFRAARRSLTRHWGYITARQKECILVEYVKLRMGNR